jgi:ribosomal protein L18
VADGQAVDPVAEPEVVDQVDVQPGAAVAGAGDGQQVDDLGGRTLAAVSWTESDLRGLKPMEQAGKAGELLAQRAKAAGVESAVFDRGGYQYHGKVKAFADGVREGGLKV